MFVSLAHKSMHIEYLDHDDMANQDANFDGYVCILGMFGVMPISPLADLTFINWQSSVPFVATEP